MFMTYSTLYSAFGGVVLMGIGDLRSYCQYIKTASHYNYACSYSSAPDPQI